MNTVWQPVYYRKILNDMPSRVQTPFYIGTLIPGVLGDGSTNVDAFDNQHTLQRIRGQCVHQVEPATSAEGIVPVNLAAFRVPAEIGFNVQSDADMPNLWESGAGENYPYFESVLCGYGDSQPSQNIHEIDNRSKRKMDPGDVLVLSGTYYNDGTATTLDLHLALNLRFLWGLRK